MIGKIQLIERKTSGKQKEKARDMALIKLQLISFLSKTEKWNLIVGDSQRGNQTIQETL